MMEINFFDGIKYCYSSFTSNRPRAEQLGIIKSMLHRAHELCDEGEPLDTERELLSNAFIANGYHPKDVDHIVSTYQHQKSKKNEEAEHGCDTICIPYVRGPSDSLRKQPAKEGANPTLKRGRTLQQFLFNGEPKRTEMFATKFHALTAPLATSERLLSGGMKENPNTKEV